MNSTKIFPKRGNHRLGALPASLWRALRSRGPQQERLPTHRSDSLSLASQEELSPRQAPAGKVRKKIKPSGLAQLNCSQSGLDPDQGLLSDYRWECRKARRQGFRGSPTRGMGILLVSCKTELCKAWSDCLSCTPSSAGPPAPTFALHSPRMCTCPVVPRHPLI